MGRSIIKNHKHLGGDQTCIGGELRIRRGGKLIVEAGAQVEGIPSSEQIDRLSEEIVGLKKAGTVEVDATLTQEGKAADAKAVGSKVNSLSRRIDGIVVSAGGNAEFPFTAQRQSLNLYDEKNVEVISGEWWSGETVGSAVTTTQMNDNYERLDIPVNGVSAVTFSVFGILARAANLWTVHCVDSERKLLSLTYIKSAMESAKTVEVPEGTTNLLVSFINYKSMLSYDTHMMVNEGVEAAPWQGYWEAVQNADGQVVIYNDNLDQYDRGYMTINAGMFARGTIPDGEVVYQVNRAVTPSKIVFDRDVRVTVADGYRYAVWTYDADGAHDSNLLLGPCEIKAGNQVRFVVARSTENASETIDVAQFAAALHIHNRMDDRLDNLENSNTVLRDLGGKIEYVAITGNAGGLVDNCAESILLAAHCGLDAVEVDIRLAADGVPVLAHVSDISTYTDAPGGTLISDVTSVEMKAYRYNKYDYIPTFIPNPVRLITLAECIDLCKRYGMRIYLDIKDDGYDHDHQTELLDAVITATLQAGIDNSCCFISTNQESRLYIRKRLPHAIIGYKTYIDSKTVESDLIGVSEIGGNIMLQAETYEGSAESVRAALTAERIAAYREKKLPIKDVDYYFVLDKPDACASGLRYVFSFATEDGGQSWSLNENQSSAIAKNGAATLTLVNSDTHHELRFECNMLNGDLLRVARPACALENTFRVPYTVQYTDTGISFKANEKMSVSMSNVKVYVTF